jgi:uncharacterized membrane protein YgcG
MKWLKRLWNRLFGKKPARTYVSAPEFSTDHYSRRSPTAVSGPAKMTSGSARNTGMRGASQSGRVVTNKHGRDIVTPGSYTPPQSDDSMVLLATAASLMSSESSYASDSSPSYESSSSSDSWSGGGGDSSGGGASGDY